MITCEWCDVGKGAVPTYMVAGAMQFFISGGRIDKSKNQMSHSHYL